MWVHCSQLCLNGKYTCISRQLLTDQLFLPVLHFVFKGKPHFSFLSSPARLVQAQRDCSTRQGSDLFSSSRQEGAGCHRSWCFLLHYTTHHTHTLLFWIILSSQLTLSELCNIANLASTLFTRCFASVTSAISNVDRDLKAQKSPHNSATGQAPHSVSTTATLPWDRLGHAVVSGSPILPLKGRAWFQSTHSMGKTDSVDYPEDLKGGGMGREIHCKKKVFSRLKEKNPALFATWKEVLKLIHFCSLHSAAQVHTASSSTDLF